MKIAVQLGHIDGRSGADHEEATILLIAPYVIRFLQDSGHIVDRFTASLEREPSHNQYNYDVAIFLHGDAADEDSSGVSVGYWEKEHPGSRKLAETLLNYYCRQTGLKPSQGGYNITVDEAHYYANRRFAHHCKCVLLEMGYVSNPKERAFLVNECRRIGKIISDAINTYLGVQPTSKKEEDEVSTQTSGKPVDRYEGIYNVGEMGGKLWDVWAKVQNKTPSLIKVKFACTTNNSHEEITLDVEANKILQVQAGKVLGAKGNSLVVIEPDVPCICAFDHRPTS